MQLEKLAMLCSGILFGLAVVAMLVAVPISLSIIGDTLLPNNLLNQYLWVAIIGVPPLFLHIVLRWCSCFYANKWLTKRFE